jgi:ornithine cyclodeaminase/alanine dehydrogenase-like protein (mu-crystallin family)
MATAATADAGPTLFLSEDDVQRLLTMDMALEAVEQGLRRQALEEAQNIPRTRCQTDHVMLHVLSASAKPFGSVGLKAYTTTRQAARFYLMLFDGRSGALTALMQADYLGQVRTGAASGVATKYLARTDATLVGIFGTGKQARTQVQAICAVRKVRRVQVYGRDEARRRRFAEEMSELCQTEVVPVSRPEDAASGQDIVITATTSREPVLSGSWIADGTHLNVIGSNFAGKSEVDVATLRRATTIIVDSKDQARQEAGDLLPALEEGAIHWADVHELGQVIAGRFPGRERPQDVTVFKSLGVGIEDVAVAARVLAKARAEGVGRPLDV